MKPLFEIRDIDMRVYEDCIRGFLPDEIIDIHTHVWLDRFRAKAPGDPARAVTWPARVALDNSVEDLIETYRLMFPGKKVTPLIFPNLLSRDDRIDDANDYVAICAKTHRFPALLFAMPWWTGEDLERRIRVGGYCGVKVYLTFSDPKIAEKDIQIFDYIPHHQLEVLDRHGWLLMLHIPRPGRLRDPLNLSHMLEIERRYPNVRLIIAHVGRAYCPEDVGNAFEVLGETKKMTFDISANTSAENFEKLVRAVGPRRVLFGSDLPILRMRMRRICENGRYVNLVPKGLYGDVSGDAHMRELEGPQADRLTFFMYEEINAFRHAAEAVGLSRQDVADVFYHNARHMLEGVTVNG